MLKVLHYWHLYYGYLIRMYRYSVFLISGEYTTIAATVNAGISIPHEHTIQCTIDIVKQNMITLI